MQAVVCAKINKTNTIRKNKRRNNYDNGKKLKQNQARYKYHLGYSVSNFCITKYCT